MFTMAVSDKYLFRNIHMLKVCCLFTFFIVTSTHALRDNSEEVKHLIGDPDFRGVSLRWEYEQPSEGKVEGVLEDPSPPGQAFHVKYCELQAWGTHRCRSMLVEDKNENDNQVVGGSTATIRKKPRHGRQFSTRIDGLRMATTYSFEVRPIPRGLWNRTPKKDTPAKSIIVPTKGFSARATQCLPYASEVEVSTGPHFGGRIAVEAADGERCAVSGDATSSRDTYTLRIDHEECGSEVNDTTVATFVIVQENLPILTHSTRRFLVICSYKPETLTVRAGINLPSNGASPNVRFYRPHQGQADPYDVEDSSINEVQPARLEARLGDYTTGTTAQAVLMILLVIAGLIGVALVMWRIIPGVKNNNSDTASVASYSNSTLSRNTVMNLDDQSDSGSIYSISLSECGHCGDNSKQNTDHDNTSEA